ncbi:phosphoribosylamine--glycine ligase [Thalassobacillus devorans]|uniref:phosphoribosylamine--glycine ligase n=1 Tax=Thalassobacillus devorans TaxID=279813 RepID=UPI00048C9A39|nr:phosphoribosylamine--glycine ligase [Thalassobacillus devorans]
MNVLVIGRGGREHSIIQKIHQSPQVNKIFAAPGNGGMDALAERVAINETDSEGLLAFAREHEVGLTIVGPENPLMAGVIDEFQKAGLTVFGPDKQAAEIEGSKHFAKALMEKYDIPTAGYSVFTDPNEAKAYIDAKGVPIVIKADGIAAGKGVVVAETDEEAKQAVDRMLIEGQYGEASKEIVIEEFLQGEEFSLMAFVNGEQVYAMLPSQDHKRAFDGDKGPNTGGMGAYAPVPFLSDEDIDAAISRILNPAAKALADEGRPFTGILYAGLIQTEEGPKVIEFNARFGDPETQVVLPLLKNDLVQVMLDVLEGNDPQLQWKQGYCGGVVVASEGYPEAYEKGKPLPDLPIEESLVTIIHAGTKRQGNRFVSDGGRVLLAYSYAMELEEAMQNVYQKLQAFDDSAQFFYRTDIAKRALRPSFFHKSI